MEPLKPTPPDPDQINYIVYFNDGDEMTVDATRCEHRPSAAGGYEYAFFGLTGEVGKMCIPANQVEDVIPSVGVVQETVLTKDTLETWAQVLRN